MADERPAVPPRIEQPTKASPPPAAAPSLLPATPVSPPASQVAEVPVAPKKLELSPTPDPKAVAAIDRPAPAVPPADKQPADAKAPSQDLFNGKDLAGWQGSREIWKVENGAITGSLGAGQKRSAFLSSQQKYKDFDLRFVVSLADGIGDCGVQFRSQVIDPETFQVSGFQCAIYGKDAPKDHRTGSLVTEPRSEIEKNAPPKLVERFVKPVENHFRIRCQGKHVLIAVNGVKLVNADFPTLPDEGVIAWKLDASRPARKASFKITSFTDLTALPSHSAPERPSLVDARLLKAEIEFESAMKRADMNLMRHFDVELKKAKSSRTGEKQFVAVIEHEKELFKEKGLIPWSHPMRKAYLQYRTELVEARRTIGNVFDAAIDRADKNHNADLKEALLKEAEQVLAPREVAGWQITGQGGKVFRHILYSDGTAAFVNGTQRNESGSRFWMLLPGEDVLVLEFPDGKDSAVTNEQAFRLSPDGKSMTTTAKNGEKRSWNHVEDSVADEGS